MTQQRDPDGVVHIWYNHDEQFLEPETVCEYADNRVYWPRERLKETSDAPTCVSCVARWRP